MTIRSLRPVLALGLLAALSLASSAVRGAGSTAVDAPKTAELTPEQQAVEHFNRGIAERDSAWRLEEKAATVPSDEKRQKLEGKISRAYERAVREFRSAIDADAGMHQAHGSLGYALRQLGHPTEALEAYDRALALEPGYVEALEYRAEAYLALGRIDDAKTEHGALAERSPRLAGELLGAMKSWIAARRDDPRDTTTGALDAFERWVDERLDGRAGSVSTLRKSRSW